MPVKIVSVDNSDDPRVITLAAYQDGRDNFDLHYFYTSEDETFIGQDFKIHWDDLQTAVEGFIEEHSLQPEDVAMRFVHCFNTDDHSLFMRLQLCTMTYSGQTEQNMPEYTLNTTYEKWYHLSEGLFREEDANHELRGDVYFNNFYYMEVEGSGDFESLNDGPTEFVKNIVFPWATEVWKLYDNNGQPANAYIHFAACSYTGGYPGSANVTWPHGWVMYRADSQDVPYLNNDQDYLVIFSNKGADCGTLCPPQCDVYVFPIPAVE